MRVATLLLAVLLSHGCDTRLGRSLPSAGACAASCAIECAHAGHAGSCAARCGLACLSGWVSELLADPASARVDAAAGETALSAGAESAGPPRLELPAAGDSLYVPVRGPDGQVMVLSGKAAADPIHVRNGAYVVRFADGRGPSMLLPLCPPSRPRHHCASPAWIGELDVPGGLPGSVSEFGSLTPWSQ